MTDPLAVGAISLGDVLQRLAFKAALGVGFDRDRQRGRSSANVWRSDGVIRLAAGVVDSALPAESDMNISAALKDLAFESFPIGNLFSVNVQRIRPREPLSAEVIIDLAHTMWS